MTSDEGSGRADGEPRFTVEVYHTKYLPWEARELHAVVSVTARGLTGHIPRYGYGRPAAEVILVDTSGSMEFPPEKMRAARHATAAAIAAIRDGVYFAVAGGSNTARMIYPKQRKLVEASASTRESATIAAGTLTGNGGTAIGSWLSLASRLFDNNTLGIRHTLLFTDGQNRDETRAQLDRVLEKCNGRFVCDARGIGTDWQEGELHRIVSVLNGRSDAVRAYGDMEDDFRELMRGAMNLAVPDVILRVSTSAGTWLRNVRQVYPTVADVTGRPVTPGIVADYNTGSWTDEQRHYQLTFDVDPAGRPTDVDTLAATVELVIGQPGERSPGGDASAALADIALPAEQPILLHWTSDADKNTERNDVVDHYTGQQELGEAIRAGCEAIRHDDDPAAVKHLGRAVALAVASSNQEALRRLAALVEIVDPAAGRVRLLRDSELQEVVWTEAGSRASSRWTGDPSPLPSPPAGQDATGGVPGDAEMPARTCPGCGLEWPGGHQHCERCGSSLHPERATP
jgi:hypothetical protein